MLAYMLSRTHNCRNPYSTILSFAFVLALTAIKDGYEDYMRYKSDKEANNQQVPRTRTQQDTEVHIMCIRVFRNMLVYVPRSIHIRTHV